MHGRVRCVGGWGSGVVLLVARCVGVCFVSCFFVVCLYLVVVFGVFFWGHVYWGDLRA